MNWETAWAHIDCIEGLLGGSVVEHWLFDITQSLPGNAIILEIGAYLGRSTSCLALGCVGTKKHVYSIDTFCGSPDFPVEEDFYSRWESNLEGCELLDYVTSLRGLSSSFYDDWSKPIDFLFIDGSHLREIAIADFEAFSPWLVPDGLVAMHDVAPPGAKTSHPGRYHAWHDHIVRKLRDVGYAPVAHGRLKRG